MDYGCPASVKERCGHSSCPGSLQRMCGWISKVRVGVLLAHRLSWILGARHLYWLPLHYGPWRQLRSLHSMALSVALGALASPL
jgi:hypothetical protein